jgi:phosphohistidine phosphatase SixA
VILAALALLIGVPATPQDTTRLPTVVVVRHAEKASETDRDPPLSALGVARAAALDSVLEHAKVVAIIVTPYRRTLETAMPVARRHMITPIVVPVAGGVAAHAYAVAQAARGHDGVVLVVGHSNTVLPIVRALGGPTLADLCDASYAQLFTVSTHGSGASRVIRTQFGAADPLHAASCPAMMPQ